MTMDETLAAHFKTGSGATTQPSVEDAEKVAQADLFAKMAATHGVDLSKMSPAQIEWMYQQTFSTKEAGDGGGFPPKGGGFPPKKGDAPPGDEEDDKKKRGEKARQEHEEKKAAQERHEQATTFGKTAAHAYTAEMRAIAAAGGLDFMKEAQAKVASATAARIQIGAFEREAAELALAKLAQAGYDTDVAIDRLNTLLGFGLAESEKVASIKTYEEALEQRALEYAAVAGYKVHWNT